MFIGLTAALTFAASRGQEIKAKKFKLGSEVNTSSREILPLVSADGQTLYFVREWYVDDDIRKEMKAKMLGGLDEKTIQDLLKNPALDESMKADLIFFEFAMAPFLPESKVGSTAVSNSSS